MQKETLMCDRNFEKILLEAVDEGLSSLGDSPKYAVYFYLKKEFKLDKRDIPHKIEEFADAIEKIFGLGAKFLEILIIKRLYEKVGHEFEYNQEITDLIFTEYVDATKKSFEKTVKQKVVQ